MSYIDQVSYGERLRAFMNKAVRVHELAAKILKVKNEPERQGCVVLLVSKVTGAVMCQVTLGLESPGDVAKYLWFATEKALRLRSGDHYTSFDNRHRDFQYGGAISVEDDWIVSISGYPAMLDQLLAEWVATEDGFEMDFAVAHRNEYLAVFKEALKD